MSDKTIRCTICRAEFAPEDTADANACPHCGAKSLPMAIADDVTVKANWFELRVLGIWAERWAVQGNQPEMVQSVRAIAAALEAQYPARTPLTLSGELRELREKLPNKVELGDPRFYVPSADDDAEPGA